MKVLRMLTILLSIILSMLEFVVLVHADKLNEPTKGPTSQQQQQQQLKHHHSMSCYACSTMDYDNPADNSCRVMRQQNRLPSLPNMHQSHQTSNLDGSVNPSYPTTINSHLNQNSAQITDSYTSTTTAVSSVINKNGYSNQHQASDNVTNQAHSNQTLVNDQYLASQALGLRNSPDGFIRTRPCFEDENFCSIVSVVRIEFANDNLIARFWAMERNCSRSCNTGCMLIGERVRLRVCSQCCRTPNCNIGSGASSYYYHHTKTVLILIAISLLLTLRAHKH